MPQMCTRDVSVLLCVCTRDVSVLLCVCTRYVSVLLWRTIRVVRRLLACHASGPGSVPVRDRFVEFFSRPPTLETIYLSWLA